MFILSLDQIGEFGDLRIKENDPRVRVRKKYNTRTGDLRIKEIGPVSVCELRIKEIG